MEPTGKAIRNMRKRLKISQSKLSELTGIPQTTISGWERGFEPNVKGIKAVAIAFGCSYQDLLDSSQQSAVGE